MITNDTILYSIELEFEGNRTEKISVRKNQYLDDIARDYCEPRGLGLNVQNVITEMLTDKALALGIYGDSNLVPENRFNTLRMLGNLAHQRSISSEKFPPLRKESHSSSSKDFNRDTKGFSPSDPLRPSMKRSMQPSQSTLTDIKLLNIFPAEYDQPSEVINRGIEIAIGIDDNIDVPNLSVKESVGSIPKASMQRSSVGKENLQVNDKNMGLFHTPQTCFNKQWEKLGLSNRIKELNSSRRNSLDKSLNNFYKDSSKKVGKKSPISSFDRSKQKISSNRGSQTQRGNPKPNNLLRARQPLDTIRLNDAIKQKADLTRSSLNSKIISSRNDTDRNTSQIKPQTTASLLRSPNDYINQEDQFRLPLHRITAEKESLEEDDSQPRASLGIPRSIGHRQSEAFSARLPTHIKSSINTLNQKCMSARQPSSYAPFGNQRPQSQIKKHSTSVMADNASRSRSKTNKKMSSHAKSCDNFREYFLVDRDLSPPPEQVEDIPEPEIYLNKDKYMKINKILDNSEEAQLTRKQLLLMPTPVNHDGTPEQALSCSQRLYNQAFEAIFQKERLEQEKIEREERLAASYSYVPQIDRISEQLAKIKHTDLNFEPHVFNRLIDSGNKLIVSKHNRISTNIQQASNRSHYVPQTNKRSEMIAKNHMIRHGCDTAEVRDPFTRLYRNKQEDFYCRRKSNDKGKSPSPSPSPVQISRAKNANLQREKSESPEKNLSFLERMNADMAKRKQKADHSNLHNASNQMNLSSARNKESSADRSNQRSMSRASTQKEACLQLYSQAMEKAEKMRQIQTNAQKESKQLSEKKKLNQRSEDIIDEVVKRHISTLFSGFDRNGEGFVSFENILAHMTTETTFPPRFVDLIKPFLDQIVEKKMTLDSLAFTYSLKKFIRKLSIEEKRIILCLDYIGKNTYIKMLSDRAKESLKARIGQEAEVTVGMVQDRDVNGLSKEELLELDAALRKKIEEEERRSSRNENCTLDNLSEANSKRIRRLQPTLSLLIQADDMSDKRTGSSK